MGYDFALDSFKDVLLRGGCRIYSIATYELDAMFWLKHEAWPEHYSRREQSELGLVDFYRCDRAQFRLGETGIRTVVRVKTS